MDMEMITDLMEAVMILCFGLSWPISIRKSWVSRTAKGKSLFLSALSGSVMYSVSLANSCNSAWA